MLNRSWFILTIVASIFAGVQPIQAQIVPDGTLGSERSRLTPQVQIQGGLGDRIDGGAVRGVNLFHSFSEFNVKAGQRLYFANPTGIENILTRITGKNVSNINGTLGVNGSANLFLMNPNGIIFGQNASLDLRGSFLATTATAIGFGTQGNFSAINPTAPPLLTIQPSAYLFERVSPGNITVQAPTSADSDRVQLKVPLSRTLALLGGNINLNGAYLTARIGRVEIGAVGGTGTVEQMPEGQFRFPSSIVRGDVALSGRSVIDVAYFGRGGTVEIYGRDVNLTRNSFIRAGVNYPLFSNVAPSGNIAIDATDSVRLSDGSILGNALLAADRRRGSEPFSPPNSIANNGNILINTGSLILESGSEINTSTNGRGDAGSIIINARDLVLISKADTVKPQITSRVEADGIGRGGNIEINTDNFIFEGGRLRSSTDGRGNAGNIAISANRVSIDGNAVTSRVEATGIGNGGNITINTGTLSLTNGGQIDGSTYGRGNSGDIAISARDRVSIDGFQLSTGGRSALYSTATKTSGNGGSITISTGSLSMTNGGSIFAQLEDGRGQAGNITINARDRVELDKLAILSSGLVGDKSVGLAGNIVVTTGTLSITNDALISSRIRDTGRGRAGNITINARDQILVNNSGVLSSIESNATGSGGNVFLTAGTLSLANEAYISTQTDPKGRGNAGNVTINVRDRTTLDNSTISSAIGTNAIGSSGDLTVTTRQLSVMNGGRLQALSAGRGNAGNIRVQAQQIFFAGASNDGTDSGIFNGTRSTTIGNAGSIEIQTNDLAVGSSSRVSVSSLGRGNAGSIKINAANSVRITGKDARIQAETVLGSQGEGGNIVITAPFLSLKDQGTVTTESATVNGGNIRLSSDVLLIRRGGQISATAGVDGGRTGNGGNININAKAIVGVPGEDSSIRANAFQGQGGNVQISTDSLLGLAQGIDITASSTLGVQGNVSIAQPEIQPTQGTIELPVSPIPGNQLSQLCPRGTAARKLGSFVVSGRGSAPPNPIDALTGSTPIATLATLDSTSTTSVTPVKRSPEIIEAQGWIKSPDGTVELVAHTSERMAPTQTSLHGVSAACH